ncbi:MAG: hypothetical protein VB016_05525 [Methanomassiliicoccaceae archaeon]|nr:hypothetical protein [Methanomassiliicoccaceae archaeon]
MKIYEAYKLAIETGKKNDPRSQAEVDIAIKEEKAKFDSLSDDKKQLYDQERLWNPYADSRFSALIEESKELEAERFMWGIDIGTGEMLLADRLREKGQTISAVVAHHPTGMSKVPFPEVMRMQTDMYASEGVPINVCESLMKPRMDEVLRNVMGSNFNQSSDAATLLGIPMFNIHSPADNMVQKHMDRLLEDLQPRNLGDIVDRLLKEPEMIQAAKYNNPPTIIVGSKDNRCGRAVAKMTGGTSGPKEIYDKFSQAGVGTVVGMHFPESHIEEARKAGINLVISGHMASDSIGINLICDVWEEKGIEVFGCSGLIRHSRN